MTRAEMINTLTQIKGVGKAKAELLYDSGFTSVEKIQKASIEDLAKVKGITEEIAQSIIKQLSVEKSEKKPKAKKKDEPKKPAKKTKKETAERPAPKAEKDEVKSEEQVEIVEEKKDAYRVKKKPQLTDEQIHQLALRKKIKQRTPRFVRQEWFRYKRIPMNWRRPNGISSKMRMHFKYRPSVVRVGFRGPKKVRGLHPSGMQEVPVCTLKDLETINPKTQAARIHSTVGTKKRGDIIKRAEELDIRILNMRV